VGPRRSDLIGALDSLSNGHDGTTLSVPDELPSAQADFGLLVRALANVISSQEVVPAGGRDPYRGGTRG
jgi:hypothetical protein